MSNYQRVSAESRTFDECLRLRTSDHQEPLEENIATGLRFIGIRFTSSTYILTPLGFLGGGSNLLNNHGSFSTTKDGNIYIYGTIMGYNLKWYLDIFGCFQKRWYTPKHGCLDLGNMIIDEILAAHSNLVMDYSFDITVSGILLHCYWKWS